jgi:hypothetical protein
LGRSWPDKDRVFRDPVHGIIELAGDDRRLSMVLETAAFQRLRRIKQMGFAWLVYPGAEHSRFGHALGAYHIASRIAARLELDRDVGRHVRLAALLHDIGHGPFSHSWEQVFPEIDHERWGLRIVTDDPELAELLEAIEPGLAAAIAGFWDKSYQPRFARKLVSSQIDVDRLDYLLRDGHYSGAGYATYDLDWILHALRLETLREGSDPDVVIDYRRGMYAVEQYLFARTYMYAQVYHHKTVRAAEHMFVTLLRRYRELAGEGREPPGLAAVAGLCRGAEVSVADYLALDDVVVGAAMQRWAGRAPGEGAAADPLIRDLSARLIDRRLFKTIDLGDDPAVAAEIAGPAEAIARERLGESGRYYVHLDTAEQIGYEQGEGEGELHVVGHPRHGVVTLGALLAELPLGQPTQTVRLVCAPELVADLLPLAERVLGRGAAS